MKTSIWLEIWASWTISLGICAVRACIWPDLRRWQSAVAETEGSDYTNIVQLDRSQYTEVR
jgi:hypothetical protein